MKRFRFASVVAMALLAVAYLAAAAQAAYTIRGVVRFPNGTPAAGVTMALYSHTGIGLDQENSYWKIPNYDFHRTVTGPDGSFRMDNVLDYPQNTTHRYIIFYDGPSPFYHCTVHVLLDARTDRNFEITLKEATAIRLRLTDAAGSPYHGTRAVYMQSGTLGQGPVKGISYVKTVNFVNGVGELPNVVIKDGTFHYGKVGILNFATADEAKAQMEKDGVPLNDTDQPLNLYVMKDSSGMPLNHSPNYVVGGYTDLTYSL